MRRTYPLAALGGLALSTACASGALSLEAPAGPPAPPTDPEPEPDPDPEPVPGDGPLVGSWDCTQMTYAQYTFPLPYRSEYNGYQSDFDLGLEVALGLAANLRVVSFYTRNGTPYDYSYTYTIDAVRTGERTYQLTGLLGGRGFQLECEVGPPAVENALTCVGDLDGLPFGWIAEREG